MGDWFFCKSISKMMKDFPADVKNNLKFEILQLTMKRQIEQMNKEWICVSVNFNDFWDNKLFLYKNICFFIRIPTFFFHYFI